MNIVEVANFVGRDLRTVRRWIAKAGDNVSKAPHDTMSQGIPHNYTLDEVESILNASSLSKDAVLILMGNAREKENVSNLPAVIDDRQVDIMTRSMATAIQSVMVPMFKVLVDEMKTANVKPITAPVEDYYSLLAYCSLHSIKTNRSELAVHGRALRIMTIGASLELRKIHDERWGQVNSYPVEILDDYFTV